MARTLRRNTAFQKHHCSRPENPQNSISESQISRAATPGILHKFMQNPIAFVQPIQLRGVGFFWFLLDVLIPGKRAARTAVVRNRHNRRGLVTDIDSCRMKR